MSESHHPRRWAFTLIELLIVVAIIAILAAIAVPNFLEAQTRAKVSRAKADMRTIATGLETYRVDNNSYPTGWGILVDPAADSSHSLFILTTPIQYLTNGDIQDPFHPARSDSPMYTTLQYDPMSSDDRMFSADNVASSHDGIPAIGDGVNAPWWLLFSVGPDKDSGFYGGPEHNVQVRVYEAGSNPGAFLDTFYDPTNGSVSVGNLWRAGGDATTPAGQMIQRNGG